jgi:hypothetical protein
MLVIQSTRDILLNAHLKDKKMGLLNNSIMSGKGNFDGFVGENALKHYLNIPLTLDQNTYDYDVVYQDFLIDVKSKKTSVIPRPDYECSVANYNTRQKCTHYVFTRILYHPEKRLPNSIYIMGFLPKEEYYAKARFLQKGQKDGSNGFIVRSDCWNLPYSQLRPIEELCK